MRNHKKITRNIGGSHNTSRCEVTGKIKYWTYSSAERRRKYEHRSLGLKESRKVHYCQYCHAWHITHNRTNKRRLTPHEKSKRWKWRQQ